MAMMWIVSYILTANETYWSPIVLRIGAGQTNIRRTVVEASDCFKQTGNRVNSIQSQMDCWDEKGVTPCFFRKWSANRFQQCRKATRGHQGSARGILLTATPESRNIYPSKYLSRWFKPLGGFRKKRFYPTEKLHSISISAYIHKVKLAQNQASKQIQKV